GKGAMTAVVEDQPVFRVDRVQEIGAESDRETDDAGQGSRRRIIRDVAGLQGHGSEKTQVVRRRYEHINILVSARPFDRRPGMIERQADAEYFLLRRRRSEFLFQSADIGQIDV